MAQEGAHHVATAQEDDLSGPVPAHNAQLVILMLLTNLLRHRHAHSRRLHVQSNLDLSLCLKGRCSLTHNEAASRQDFRQWSSPTQGQMAPDTRLCILPPSATISLVKINSLVSLFHPSHKAVHTAIHRQAKRLRFKTRSWYAADALG